MNELFIVGFRVSSFMGSTGCKIFKYLGSSTFHFRTVVMSYSWFSFLGAQGGGLRWGGEFDAPKIIISPNYMAITDLANNNKKNKINMKSTSIVSLLISSFLYLQISVYTFTICWENRIKICKVNAIKDKILALFLNY